MVQLLLFIGLFSAPPEKQLITALEKDFYTHTKQFDKERNSNYTAQFKRLFQKHGSSPYQLHTEIVQVERKSELEAKNQAKATGFKEREYVRFIGDIRESYMQALQKKYGLSFYQRTMFLNNYCFCYAGKTAIYCQNGRCKLD